jgi:hypothetical protein
MKINVLGLGESLINYTPTNTVTIGVNDIYKHFNTEHIVCVDKPNRFDNYRQQIIRDSRPKTFFSQLDDWRNIAHNYKKIEFAIGRGKFDELDSDKICFGCSSPLVATVIAYKMGAKEIELFGVDFNTHPNFVDNVLNRAIREFVALKTELDKRGVILKVQPQSKLNLYFNP